MGLSPVLHRSTAMILAFLAISQTKTPACAITFLPDDAQIACRAILPNCFTRSGWADLCLSDDAVMEGHPEACRQATQGADEIRVDDD